MVMPIRLRSYWPTPPPAGSVYVAVGDSITDPYEMGPWPGGQYADTVAALFGWTRTGAGTTANGQMVASGASKGSGYTANQAAVITAVGGGTGAAGTGFMFGGQLVGVTITNQGTGYTQNQSCTFGAVGGGSGAVAFLPWDGAGHLKQAVIPGTSSYDAARAAIGGTAMQAGGVNGNDFASNVAARCTAYSPKVVSIFLGTNDYFYKIGTLTTAATFKAGFKGAYQGAITAIRTAQPGCLLILIGMHNVTTAPNGGLPAWAATNGDAIQQINAATAELAFENGALFVPLNNLPASTFAGDGIHPTQTTGHAFIAQAVQDAIMGVR